MGWQCAGAASKTWYCGKTADDVYFYWLASRTFKKRRRILNAMPPDRRLTAISILKTFDNGRNIPR